MAKVWMVEDDESIKDLVTYALRSNGFEAHGFEGGGELFACLEKEIPDLLLLDIMLPGEDGFNILKALRQKNKTAGIPVVLLTAKSGEYDKIKGLDWGADDYITKPFSVLELLSRIKAVLRRTRREETKTIAHNAIFLDMNKHVVTVEGVPVNLTFKEFELLYFLLENKGLAMPRDRIIEQVWGYDYEGESRTVDMHIKTLRQKLGQAGEIIQTVRGIGYKIGE